MKVEFADSFWKSLKRLSMHQTWWYKTYEVFRYKIPMFVENIWYFRKEMWQFRSWDYTFNLGLFKRSLEKTVNTIEFFGHEIDETRLKKVEKIKRVIELINNIEKGDYVGRAEKELGELKNTEWLFDGKEDTPEEREHNKKVFDLSQKLEEDEWKEICITLQGQDSNDFQKIYETLTEEQKMEYDHWKNWFDGSGLKHWWD